MAVFNIGLCNARLRRYATALRYFTAYVELPGARLKKGRRFLNRMQGKLGLSAAGKSPSGRSKISAGESSRRFKKANSLVRAKKYRRAIVAYEKLLNQPGLPEYVRASALLNAGICNYRIGRYPAAIMYYQQHLASTYARKKKGTYLMNKAKRKMGLMVLHTKNG